MYFRKTVTTSLKKAPEVATLGLSLCVPVGTISFLAIAIIAYAVPECNIRKSGFYDIRKIDRYNVDQR